MHARTFSIFLVAIFILLSGCATSNISKDFDLQSTSESGIVIGSITYEGGHSDYILHVETIDGTSAYMVRHESDRELKIASIFIKERPNPALKKTGSVFAIELPAGNYRIKGWEIRSEDSVFSTEPTGLKFTVNPKKAIYIGNYDFKVTDTTMRNPTRATMALTEKRERDLRAFRTEFPKLADISIESTIADGLLIENVGGSSYSNFSIRIFGPFVR